MTLLLLLLFGEDASVVEIEAIFLAVIDHAIDMINAITITTIVITTIMMTCVHHCALFA